MRCLPIIYNICVASQLGGRASDGEINRAALFAIRYAAVGTWDIFCGGEGFICKDGLKNGGSQHILQAAEEIFSS